MANEAKPCPCDIGDRMEYGGLGQEVQMGHTTAYVVKPSSSSDKAIIVIQDIYGWQLPNTRYIADILAANGYMCVPLQIVSFLQSIAVLTVISFCHVCVCVCAQCCCSRLLCWKGAMESIT